MKALNRSTRLFVIAMLTFTLIFLMGSLSYSQNVRNKGTIINAATINVKNFNNAKLATGGTVYNKGTIQLSGGGSFYNYDSIGSGTTGGTFRNFFGTAGALNGAANLSNGAGTFQNDSANVGGVAQVAVALSTGSGTISTMLGEIYFNGTSQTVSNSVEGKTYGTLRIGGTGTKTLAGDSTYAKSTLALAASTLDENGKVLVLDGTVTGGGTLTANGTNSTTIYNASGAQDVLAANYYNVRVQNTGQKSALGAVTVTNSLNVATSSDSLDIAANTFTLQQGASVTSSGKLKASGSVSVSPLNPTIGGTFVYYGALQTVAGANYSNLLLRTGSFTLPGTDSVAVSGTYTLENSPTTTYQSGNSFIYNGTGAQSILGGQSYYRLLAQGSTDTSLSNAKTVASAFTIQNAVGAGVSVLGATTLDMGTTSITFGLAHTDSVQGTARIRWAGSNQHIGGTGLTELYGTGSGTLAAGTYGYLWFTGAGTKDIIGAVVAQGGFGTFASIGVTVQNNVTVAGSLTVTGIDLNNEGQLSNNGTITVN